MSSNHVICNKKLVSVFMMVSILGACTKKEEVYLNGSSNTEKKLETAVTDSTTNPSADPGADTPTDPVVETDPVIETDPVVETGPGTDTPTDPVVETDPGTPPSDVIEPPVAQVSSSPSPIVQASEVPAPVAVGAAKVTSVQLKDNQFTINGTGMASVKSISLKSSAGSLPIALVPVNDTQIKGTIPDAVKLIAGVTYELLVADASAATAIPFSINLSTLSADFNIGSKLVVKQNGSIEVAASSPTDPVLNVKGVSILNNPVLLTPFFDIAQGAVATAEGGSTLVKNGPTSHGGGSASYWNVTQQGQSLKLAFNKDLVGLVGISFGTSWMTDGKFIPSQYTIACFDSTDTSINAQQFTNDGKTPTVYHPLDSTFCGGSKTRAIRSFRITADTIRADSSGNPAAHVSGVQVFASSGSARPISPFSYTYAGDTVYVGGNVGVGTSTPDTKLHVKGGNLKIEDDAGQLIIGANKVCTKDGCTNADVAALKTQNDEMKTYICTNYSKISSTKPSFCP